MQRESNLGQGQEDCIYFSSLLTSPVLFVNTKQSVAIKNAGNSDNLKGKRI